MKSAAINICIIFIGFLSGQCAPLCIKESIVAPLRITIIDNSRIDNFKLRHVFKEFFLGKIVAEGKDWLVVYNEPGGDRDVYADSTSYSVVLDIMEYGTADIEKGIAKMLASAKIIDNRDNAVIAVYIAHAKNTAHEKLCEKPAMQLARNVLKELFALKHAHEKLRDIVTETTDSP